MLRIAHISDLHILAPESHTRPTVLQKGMDRLQKAFDIHANIDGHNPEKLEALKNCFRQYRPDIIAVTGDLSTYGDAASLQLAAAILDELKEIAGARQVLCVPGNHDSLGERFTRLGRKSWWLARTFKTLQFLRDDIDGIIKNGQPMELLSAYREHICKRFNPADPSHPLRVDTDWGPIFFFCFDSTNDPGLMANEGRIGARQYNLLRQFVDDPKNQEELSGALRFALLHHHPLPIPHQKDTAYERFYNSMTDGSTMCYFLNISQFHFVLHGHQHYPYYCTIRYGHGNTPSLNILGAGTATQTASTFAREGFYLLDLLTPLQARLRVFEYKETGFDLNGDPIDFDVVPFTRYRISAPGQLDTPADAALRNLLRVNPDAIDERHQFESIDIDVTVQPDQTYIGKYRFSGTCKGHGPVGCLRRVITGSPASTWDQLQLQAMDNLNAQKLGINRLKDHPNQKFFEIVYSVEKNEGEPFDVTYQFRWKGSPEEPNDFDGINLMCFKYPVGKISYSVATPWKPVGPRMRAYGLTEQNIVHVESLKQEGTVWRYSISVQKPPSLALLISLPMGQSTFAD